MAKSDSSSSIAKHQLKLELLDVFSHYFLESEFDRWEHGYYLTDKTLRFLFASNRVLSTFLASAEDTVVATRENFCMRCRWTVVSSNPSLIIAMALTRRGQTSRCFVLDAFYTHWQVFEGPSVRLIFWAKRHDVSLYIADALKTRVISLLLSDIALIPHPLQAEKDAIQSHHGMNMENVFVLPAKDEKSERKVHYNRIGIDVLWDEGATIKKRGYLMEVFHPKATEIILEHCDGFMIYQHLPLPKMPNLRSIEAPLNLYSIGNESATFFFRKIAESLRESAPKCKLNFAADVHIYAVDFDASWQLLSLVKTAVRNSMRIVEGNPRTEINVRVHLSLKDQVNKVTPGQKARFDLFVEQIALCETTVETRWFHASTTKSSEDSGTVILQIACMFGRDSERLEGRSVFLID